MTPKKGRPGRLGPLKWGPKELRRKVSNVLADRLYDTASRLGNTVPLARPALYDVERVTDIPYTDSGLAAHTLDVYRKRGLTARAPVVLYLHGGSFRALSKDTHWMMALGFARRGCLVFNSNYRLVPEHRFPAGLQDACAAYAWVVKEAARWGGDLDRFIIAGESAGGNLALATTIATCWRRPEPWARAVFDLGVQPTVAAPFCGILQTSDAERLWRGRKMPFYVVDQLASCCADYVLDKGINSELADPLLMLEDTSTPDRPLPAVFASVGTKDPLLDDTRRLAAALTRRGVTHEAHYYPGELHAFQAMVWRRNARRHWREAFEFFERQFGAPPAG